MVSPKTQAEAPIRSLDQRMEALKRANDIRVRRARLKKDLKDGRVQIEQILSNPPEYVSTAKVFDSGAGKGTLERILLERMPDVFELAVSATTRERRPTEQEGREYYFVSENVFEQRVQEDEFLEYVDLPWGARSGTLRSEIDRIQGHGKVPLLDLETDGAIRVKETIPGAVTVFVDAPTFEELERRLRERATESSGEIQVRLDLARKQREQRDRFDHVIVNDDVERAADELEAIATRELQAAGTMSRP
jgi:guanylate kinase